MCNKQGNCKKICCRMQKSSMKLAIKNLKKVKCDREKTLSTLESMQNLVESYECLEGVCLRNRIERVYSNIQNSSNELEYTRAHQIKVEMLMAELESFMC